MKTPLLYFFVGSLILGCAKGTHSDSDVISGTYVREYSFKVVNPENGAEIGNRTIRDTLFLETFPDKVMSRNVKWGKNDYDNLGWRNLAHSDDRPLPPFIGYYNAQSQEIVSAERGKVILTFNKTTSTVSIPGSTRIFQKVAK